MLLLLIISSVLLREKVLPLIVITRGLAHSHVPRGLLVKFHAFLDGGGELLVVLEDLRDLLLVRGGAVLDHVSGGGVAFPLNYFVRVFVVAEGSFRLLVGCLSRSH